MKNTLVLTALLLVAQTTFAATTDIWEGSGTLFNLQADPVSDYQLVVENTKSPLQTDSHVTVTLKDGTVIHQNCVHKDTPKGFQTTCDKSSGGGFCMGEGLCMSYVADQAGKAFATTIIKDGASDMRLVRTELKNGQAVQFFREKLHKK